MVIKEFDITNYNMRGIIVKKLLLIVPKKGNGGIERVASNISKSLPEKYKQNIVFLYKCEEDYEFDGKLYFLDYPVAKNIFNKAFLYLKKLLKLKKIKRKIKPDLTVSFGDRSNIINILSSIGEKKILTCHSVTSIENKARGIPGKFYNYFIRKTYNYAQKIITVSNGIKHDLVNEYNILPKKIKTINNGYDINKIVKLSKEPLSKVEKEIFEKNLVFINVARIDYSKGQWHLLRIIANLKEDIPNIRLLLVGDISRNNIYNHLLKIIKQLKIQENVIFLGYKNNPYKYIRNSDLFLFSSLYEGFGGVLIESLACKTPIISSNCKYGPKEIISENNNIKVDNSSDVFLDYGALIPPFSGSILNGDSPLTKSEKIYSEAILNIINDEELYCKYKNISIKRAKDFDIKKIIKEYSLLFEE